VLGFNEPERSDQGDITVDQATNQWPQLEAVADVYGAKIGSPATANPMIPWIIDFMNKAETNNLRVDFMAMHKYPKPDNSGSILNGAQALHDAYGKDVWITEFNAADWSGSNDYTHADSYTWMAEVLYRLESTDYIKRYAIFPWDGSSSASSASAVFEPGTQNLTPLGKLYSTYRSSDVDGPFTNVWYYLHNKASKGHLDELFSCAPTNIYEESFGVDFVLQPAGINQWYIANRKNNRRLASDGTSLFWSLESSPATRWQLSDDQYCWKYIEHVATGNRLYADSNDALAMGSSTRTDSDARWTFIRSFNESENAVVNSAPAFTTADVENNFLAADALSAIPYSENLTNYVNDADGDVLSFSGSGPAWLHIETNGVLSGTPADGDYGQNTWDVIVDDGTASVTGTLNIVVRKMTIVYADVFDGTNLNTLGTSYYGSNALVTTTFTNGLLYKGGSVSLDNSTLRFARPNDNGGYASASMVLSQDLFADGAGTYSFSMDIVETHQNGTQTFVELYDVDLSSGNVKVPNVKWGGGVSSLNSITTNEGAIATMITNITYAAFTLGHESFTFEYDGSGDVLLRIGAGRASNNWWANHRIDNLMILGSDAATPYDIWSGNFGLTGPDAVSTNDYDGDGWNNLYEFGLGLNPTNNAAAGGAPPEMMNHAGGLLFVHAKHASDNSLVYYLVTADNLIDATGWTNAGYTIIGTDVTGSNYDYVTNLIDTTDNQKYVRLIIEQQ